MIVAKARIGADGLILDFEARGHAGQGPRGSDIACAAFTMLVRTAYNALAGLPGGRVEGSATGPGELDFHVRSMPLPERERAIGMTAFLLEGLSALERDFPEAIGIRMETLRRN